MPTYSGSPATVTATTPQYPTRTYKELLYAISRAAGIDPNRLLDDDALAIRDYINTALRTIWEYYPWPKLMRVGSDTYANIDNYANYDLFFISSTDPRVDRNPTFYTFSVDAGGFNIIDDNLATTATLYFTYRDRFYPFDGTRYSTITTYELDGMSYDSTTGDYYRSVVGSNLNNALTDTAWWDRRYIPAFLFEYTKLSALAQMREAEGQGEKSRILEVKATAALMAELDKWERQKNQQLRPHVRVRSGG
jgi:hypothetical protein